MFLSSLILRQPGRSREQKPDDARCLREENSDRNSSEAENSDVGATWSPNRLMLEMFRDRVEYYLTEEKFYGMWQWTEEMDNVECLSSRWCAARSNDRVNNKTIAEFCSILRNVSLSSIINPLERNSSCATCSNTNSCVLCKEVYRRIS